jgi:beta-glucosidase
MRIFDRSRKVAMANAWCVSFCCIACVKVAPHPVSPEAQKNVTPIFASGGLVPHEDSTLPESRRRARELVAQMTLEEKTSALVHVWDWSRKKTPQELCDTIPTGAGSFERIGLDRDPDTTASFVNELRECVKKRSRLHIPPFFLDEGVHGFMQKGATSFPSAVALGATWNPALIQEIFEVVAKEARSRGTNWILGPNIDLSREPRWGRTDEMYSEDPYLVARFGVAAIRGLQGEHRPFDAHHVLATAKHFAAHGQPEAGANGGPVHVAERELRGEYLAPFEAAIKTAKVGSVMAAYNEIDGVPGHLNSPLLNGILRQEWSFAGLVISDGMGVERLQTVHRVTGSRAESARRALLSGVDYEIGTTYLELADEVKAGRVPVARLDEAVERTLEAKFDLGLFNEKPLDPAVATATNNSAPHQNVALEAARQGAILLSNNGILPLDRKKLKRIAVIGPNANKTHYGSYTADPGRGISLLDGISAAVDKNVEVRFARGCNITAEDLTWEGHWKGGPVALPDPKQEQKLLSEAVRAVRGTDVAIVAIGENEATSRETWENHLGDRDSLRLLGAQEELIAALAATGVPIVLVVINGRPLEIGEVVRRSSAAIEAFYLGQETGTALAEILFGDVSPSGHLPISLPKSAGQLPIYYYRKPSARGDYLFSDAKPLFPFGHGLTYTTFTHSKPIVSPAKMRVGESARLTVTVTNSGKRRGTDLVQLYVSAPGGTVTRPIRLLKGFERVTLEPGQSQEVTFVVGPSELEVWNIAMNRVVEPLSYLLEVGANALELDTTLLEVSAS